LRFCAFLNKGNSKTPQKPFGGSSCQKRLAEKVEKKKFFPVVFSNRLFLIAFLAISLHEEPKNTIKMVSKIRPENLKKSQKKVGR
jgi:ribosomal protein L34E